LFSPAAGTRSCWAAGQWMGQLAASLLWGLCASVRLPASEISCLSEVWELKSLCWDCRFQFWNPRRSTPGPMLQERGWNPILQCMQPLQASYNLISFWTLAFTWSWTSYRSFSLQPAIRGSPSSPMCFTSCDMVSTKDLALKLAASWKSERKKHGGRRKCARLWASG
jgi:hypothetical protein